MADEFPMENTIVVVRSVGERTEELCVFALLAAGFCKSQVKTIREAPFKKALEQALMLGIDSSKKWLFCVDADVVVLPDVLRIFFDKAERSPESVCEFQGYVFDYFFGGPRQAGNHLYRVNKLPVLIEILRNQDDSPRPEAKMLLEASKIGLAWKALPLMVGAHDFEQYNRDIFRKCFTHAIKHADHRSYLANYWTTHADTNQDFKVALIALERGEIWQDAISIDIRERYFLTPTDAFGEKVGIENIKERHMDILSKCHETPSKEYQSEFPTFHGMKSLVDLLQDGTLRIRPFLHYTCAAIRRKLKRLNESTQKV